MLTVYPDNAKYDAHRNETLNFDAIILRNGSIEENFIYFSQYVIYQSFITFQTTYFISKNKSIHDALCLDSLSYRYPLTT